MPAQTQAHMSDDTLETYFRFLRRSMLNNSTSLSSIYENGVNLMAILQAFVEANGGIFCFCMSLRHPKYTSFPFFVGNLTAFFNYNQSGISAFKSFAKAREELQEKKKQHQVEQYKRLMEQQARERAAALQLQPQHM